ISPVGLRSSVLRLPASGLRLPACGFRLRASGYLSLVPATRFDSAYHAPVLVAEVLEALRLQPGARRILDGTLGGGGHSLALLEAGAHVTGLDRDPEAIAAARARLAPFESQGRFRAVLSHFADLDKIRAVDG